MAEIINLRLARKAQKRSQADTAASANRARFGQSKAQRNLQTAEAERTTRLLDGARRDKD
jgi:hypothetical protein